MGLLFTAGSMALMEMETKLGVKRIIYFQGTIVMPEIMHDTEVNEIVFEVLLDAENGPALQMKEVARKDLTKLIAQQVKLIIDDNY